MSKFDELKAQKPIVILDGAMGTELEARGYDVNDSLWSAKILDEAPEGIEQIHYDYFKAGADIGMSCSYQANVPGFTAKGYTEEQAKALIKKSMELLIAARERWWEDEGKDSGRPYPIVAGDIGPYGAYTADGDEYIGAHKLTEEEYREFHMPRIQALLDGGAEFFVIETIPRLDEAVALANIMEELGMDYWISFTFRDGKHISEGKSIPEVVEALQNMPHLKAIGGNCIAPAIAAEVVAGYKQVTHLPIVVYPNKGEVYDAHKKIWLGDQDPRPFGERAKDWKEAGATIIGGCCRTRDTDIQEIIANVL